MAKVKMVQNEIERKGKILESARAVIGRKGIQGATVRDIAEEAQLSTGALYYYYKSKEEILYALMDESLSMTSRIATKARTSHIENALLLDEISENIEKRFSKETDNKVQFYLAEEAMIGDAALTAKFHEKYHEWTGRTDELLKILYNKPKTKYDSAVAALLIGAIDGVILQKLLGTGTADICDVVKVYDLLLRVGLPDFLEHVVAMDAQE